MKLKLFIIALLAQCVSLTAMAYDAEIDGIYYNFSGTEACVVQRVSLPYSGDIVIPQSVTYQGKAYEVTEIGSSAFMDCSGLTSITIPESVTSIGDRAFDNTGWFDNQPDGLVYAGKFAYKYKGTMSENTSIDIKYGTLGVADGAFRDCTGLTSITIPESVTFIGSSAFWGCRNLASIIIPENVTSIGAYAFSSCYSLRAITIPASVTKIGYNAIYVCDNLTSIVVAEENTVYDSRDNCNALIETATNTLVKGCINTIIPEGVTCISDEAFLYCYNLISINIPASVIRIGHNSFFECNNLTSIVVAEENTVYDSRNNCNALIETATNTLVKGCINTIIPEDITCIAGRAFSSCRSLTSIDIPESVSSIGDWAFEGCSRLTSVTIPNSVVAIGDGAFYNTPWYENQPDGVIYIGKVAYKYKGTMPEGSSIDIKNGTLGIAGGAFKDCSGLNSINIPESVTNIGSYAFYGCI